jgi:hypothetical protein
MHIQQQQKVEKRENTTPLRQNVNIQLLGLASTCSCPLPLPFTLSTRKRKQKPEESRCLGHDTLPSFSRHPSFFESLFCWYLFGIEVVGRTWDRSIVGSTIVKDGE